ncbi:hypothetical protein [Streptosporangium sp. CA-115845]|uniref:hypothetical protein n=1 Tax=Streptosporangium sp. CA-115845 TaxID=3240071 RepID=UPI003D8CC43B
MTNNEIQAAPEGPATTNPRAAVITARTAADAAQSNLDYHARVCHSCRIGQDGMCAEGELLSAAFNSAIVVSVAAHEAYAPTGSTVTYHGMETRHRGPGWTVRSTVQGSWGTSYTIVRNIGRARDAAQDIVLNGVRIDGTDLEALKTRLQLNLDYNDGLVFTISLPDED